MFEEILTWFGVGVAALLTYAMYRSAERANIGGEPKEGTDD